MGEMQRLLKLKKTPKLSMEFLDNCQEFCNKKNITLVLKGGPSFIFHPGEQVIVNITGDPGMATAGSGDVLTGLIASLLAQGLSTYDASVLGVFLHGLAGEHAAFELTSRGLLASDIIYRYPEAFKFIII
jgi:NAD(P)H-hydrate epimerase